MPARGLARMLVPLNWRPWAQPSRMFSSSSECGGEGTFALEQAFPRNSFFPHWDVRPVPMRPACGGNSYFTPRFVRPPGLYRRFDALCWCAGGGRRAEKPQSAVDLRVSLPLLIVYNTPPANQPGLAQGAVLRRSAFGLWNGP